MERIYPMKTTPLILRFRYFIMPLFGVAFSTAILFAEDVALKGEDHSERLGLARPDVEFQIFQFPADKIPRIDGTADDWSLVPDSYAIGVDQLRETVIGTGDKHDLTNLDVKVKVGWVQGQNHLYFLYEATDN